MFKKPWSLNTFAAVQDVHGVSLSHVYRNINTSDTISTSSTKTLEFQNFCCCPRWLWSISVIPQTVACQHGVLAVNLINSLGYLGLASRWRPSFLSHVVGAVHILDSALSRMLLWPPGNSQLRTASSLFGSMAGTFLSHVLAILYIFEVRHLFSILVTINILQTRQ